MAGTELISMEIVSNGLLTAVRHERQDILRQDLKINELLFTIIGISRTVLCLKNCCLLIIIKSSMLDDISRLPGHLDNNTVQSCQDKRITSSGKATQSGDIVPSFRMTSQSCVVSLNECGYFPSNRNG